MNTISYCSIAAAASFEWSSDGNSIVFVGARGGTEVRQVPPFVRATMANLARRLRKDQGFWHHFPMYLPRPTPDEAMALSAKSGTSSPVRMSRNSSKSSFGRVFSGGRGGSVRGGGGMGSRVQSKGGISQLTEETASGIEDDRGFREIPTMQVGEDDLAGQLLGQTNGESKSTLHGRHSAASSTTR